MPNPTPASNWVPVVDVSRHQGSIDFNIMKSKGVEGLILRATHGSTHDDRMAQYYPDAVAAGFAPKDIGFYSFINPKRGSGPDTARDTWDFIHQVTGRDDVLYMIDVENYKNEGPGRGLSPLSGAEYSLYLREHMATFKLLSPDSFIMAYSNSAYWDSELGPRDHQLASELDWIVPRYPIYSTSGYDRRGYPPDTDQWDEYAWALKAAGPVKPAGSTWQGWQFSAGYNKQGAEYGCQSSDLDLNIVTLEAWNKWTRSSPPIDPGVPETPLPPPVLPPMEIEMNNFVSHNGVRLFDSRSDGNPGNIDAETTLEIDVAEGTPTDPVGVALNITVLNAEGPGFITVWSGLGDVPTVSQVNYGPDDASPQNGFTVTNVGVDDKVHVYVHASADVIVDQVGFIEEVEDVVPGCDCDVDDIVNQAVVASVEEVIGRLQNG